VVTKYETTLKNDGKFYTDANGRQTLLRKRNHRDTWQLNVTEPVSGNYYPVNSRIAIEDETAQKMLVVLNDRTQGGASIQDGNIELMIHRRLLYDDAFGVGEALDEPGVDGKGLIVRGSHFVYYGPSSTAKKLQRAIANKLWMQPIVTFGKFNGDVTSYRNHFNTNFTALLNPQSIPGSLNLLTLEPIVPGRSVLLRLEHLYDPNDDPQGLSKPITLDLNQFFRTPVTVTRLLEYNLAANEPLDHIHRLTWRTSDRAQPQQTSFKRQASHDTTVITLKPLEIRTFIVEYRTERKA